MHWPNSIEKQVVFIQETNCQSVDFTASKLFPYISITGIYFLIYYSTQRAYSLTLYVLAEDKTSNSSNKKNKLEVKHEKYIHNIIRQHIYSCLSSLQLWSDESSQSNEFRKCHCQPPLFPATLISSAVKHIMMSRAVIKGNWCLSLNSLLGCRCAVGRICTAENGLLQNGISIIWKIKSVLAKWLSSLVIWRLFPRKMSHH